jgi:16S rRNA processing protein RimM
MEHDDELIAIARVRKPHGLRGELIVDVLTDAPDVVLTSGRRVFAGDEDGHLFPNIPEMEITDAVVAGDGCRLSLAGVEDRTEAEKWRGRFLFAHQSTLPPLKEDEVYLHDLVGMRVVQSDVAGAEAAVGEVLEVLEMPQGLILVVKRAGAEDVLLPYRPEVIELVDQAERVITVRGVEELLQ